MQGRLVVGFVLPSRSSWSCIELGLLVAQGPSDPRAVGEDLRLITPHLS